MYFDSHAHYDDKMFDADRDLLLHSLREGGVDYVIDCGSDLTSSDKAIELAARYDFIYAAVGVHPEAVKGRKWRTRPESTIWRKARIKWSRSARLGWIIITRKTRRPRNSRSGLSSRLNWPKNWSCRSLCTAGGWLACRTPMIFWSSMTAECSAGYCIAIRERRRWQRLMWGWDFIWESAEW